MPVKVVVGAQWGDEGKGKMVDYLAQRADLVVRYQGGDNAGHTVVNQFGVFKLHIVPCGIFNPSADCLVGTGTVVHPDVLINELKGLTDTGISTDRLWISGKAHILMPYHVELDALADKLDLIGTTKRGIGPAYADRALRINLRFEDLLDAQYAEDRIKQALPEVNARLEILGGRAYSVRECMDNIHRWSILFRDRLVDAVPFVHNHLRKGSRILFEGQLGAMKDLDLGIYPYVTSSHPLAAYAAVSAGIPARCITEVTGVLKAFSSAVGGGPFPTEMEAGEAAALRGAGDRPDDEFGARTGRARRLGWLDLNIVRYAAMINGFTELALCKLDKLDDMAEIKVCTGYELEGRRIDHMPNARDLARVKPVYKTLPGWRQSTRKITDISKLPAHALGYIRFIEKAVDVPVKYVGVGPARQEVAL